MSKYVTWSVFLNCGHEVSEYAKAIKVLGFFAGGGLTSTTSQVLELVHVLSDASLQKKIKGFEWT